jgi:hypothetical protein
MNKTWTRIVVVASLAAAVAFWVYFDKQRAAPGTAGYRP